MLIFTFNEGDFGKIDDFSTWVYNRWGDLVYYSTDKYFKWDGKYNGKLYTNVVYNFIIQCSDVYTGKRYRFVGSILVL